MEIVEYKFTKVVKDITSKYTKIPKNEYEKNGLYKVIDQGQNVVAGYTNDVSKVSNFGLPVIVFGDHTRVFKYIDFPFAIGADGVKVLKASDNQIDTLYLYYFLRDLNIPSAGYSRHFKFLKDKKVKFPLSIPDQKRIAKVLSHCEDLIAKRKESLDLLDEFVRSTFLEMFGDPVRNVYAIETKAMSKIATISRGKFTPRPRNDPKYFGGDYPFIQTGNISKAKGILTKYTQTLNELGAGVSKKFEKGTIVIALVGATIGETAILGIDCYAPDSIVGIVPTSEDINAIYLEFILRFWKPVLLSRAPKAARANINNQTLKPLQIPIPQKSDLLKFTQIYERVEATKKQYNESLLELEQLYGSLSQQFFNKTKTKKNIVKKEPVLTKEKLIWENISVEKMTNLIKEKYSKYHFNIEMLFRFFEEEKGIFPHYYSSKLLKEEPNLNYKEDIKSFVFSAIEDSNGQFNNPFIKLKQLFYNAEEENLNLSLTKEDYELIQSRDKSERSGIYFEIV